MQLNIKNDEAYRLAKQLAERTGESLTEAVTNALKERLEREEARKPAAKLVGNELVRALDELSRRSAALPVLDDRPADEIIGYDENGLPS